MKTIQFEGIKVALKQDKSGYILNLSIHPDEIDESLLRDFVGARYQIVMVRLDETDQPMIKEEEYAGDRAVRIAGMLSRDPKFWSFLYEDDQIFTQDYETASEWIRNYLNVPSRSDLKTNVEAQKLIDQLHRKYTQWQPKT
jgi:hypothetical protein